MTWYHRTSKWLPSGLDMIILHHSNIIITMATIVKSQTRYWLIISDMMSPAFSGLQPLKRLWCHSTIFGIQRLWVVNNLYILTKNQCNVYSIVIYKYNMWCIMIIPILIQMFLMFRIITLVCTQISTYNNK